MWGGRGRNAHPAPQAGSHPNLGVDDPAWLTHRLPQPRQSVSCQGRPTRLPSGPLWAGTARLSRSVLGCRAGSRAAAGRRRGADARGSRHEARMDLAVAARSLRVRTQHTPPSIAHRAERTGGRRRLLTSLAQLRDKLWRLGPNGSIPSPPLSPQSRPEGGVIVARLSTRSLSAQAPGWVPDWDGIAPPSIASGASAVAVGERCNRWWHNQ